MDSFTQLFDVKPQFGVMICRACQFAVVPSQVEAHLRVHHLNKTSQERKTLQQEAESNTHLAFQKDQVKYPDPHDLPIIGLPVWEDGFKCKAQIPSGTECSYICRSRRGIQQHCKEEHNWTNPRKRGRNSKRKDYEKDSFMWVEKQHCQRFFEFAQWKRYFKVEQRQQESRKESEQEALESKMDKLAQVLEDRMLESRLERNFRESSNRYLPNPWLEFVGWDRHLKAFAKTSLLEMIQLPELEPKPESRETERQNNRLLKMACTANQNLIRKAMAICDSSIVGRSALEFVNRRETGQETSERPFYSQHKASTMKKYAQVWARILAYIWRSMELEDSQKPSYQLTLQQERLINKIKLIAELKLSERKNPSKQDQEKEKLQQYEPSSMEKVCLDFWVSMFDHELKAGEFESGIISGLAVLGLNTKKERWNTAMNYTPILSAVVTVMRSLVVYKAWIIHKKEVQDLIDTGSEEKEAQAKAPSIFEEVKEMVQRFMTLTTFNGMPSPMDRILHMRTYGMKIRYTTKGEARVTWKGDEICIDKVSFTMEELRSVVHGLNESARQKLLRDLLLIEDNKRIEHQNTNLPELDLRRLYDNPAELAEDWNFLDDPRTQWTIDGKKWMFKRLSKEYKLEKKFFQSELDSVESWKGIEWNQKSVEDYFRKVSKFKEELLALVHLTAGAPARGTEILTIQHTNGEDSRAQRGIFLEDGMVAFVTRYHKGYSSSQKMKVIHRYVPQEVGELVVYYLWLVEPFVKQLQLAARAQDKFSTFLWEPEPDDVFTEEEFENDENSESESGEVEREADSETTHSEDEESQKEAYENQASKAKEQTARNVDGFWGTDRVRRVLQKETYSRIGTKISTAIWRQAYPAIQREFSQEREVKGMLDEIYESKETEVNDWASRQSGHSRRMEEMIYGISMSESPFQTRSERMRYRKVSVDWHRFLHFTSAWEQTKDSNPDSKEQYEKEQQMLEARRWQRVKETNQLQVLRSILGPAATFRGLQQAGLEAIANRASKLLVIMRTGGGKSLFFMLPAASSKEGVSIVVVPLISLREDLRNRCKQAGITCAEWDGKSPPFWASIILVTPESAVTKAFSRFINQKKMLRQLDRIVVDECHMVLDSSDKWRPQLKQLIEMGEKGTQVVYLTATLPPADEQRFLAAMTSKTEEVQILRDTTTRPNIQYSVVEFEREAEDDIVKELVDRKKEENPLPGQIIIYTKSIAQTKRLSQVLECPAYYRNVGTEEKKSKILQSLIQKREQVFVATNALGLGVDIPHVRVVIHMGIRSKMIEYAQESGRAGRDGKKSEAIILRSYSVTKNGDRVKENGWNTEKSMQEFVKENQCKRVVLDRVMDGREDRKECEPEEVKCDACLACLAKKTGSKRSRADYEPVDGRANKAIRTSGLVEDVRQAEEEEKKAEREKQKKAKFEAQERETEKLLAEKKERKRKDTERMQVEKEKAAEREAEKSFDDQEQKFRAARAEKIREIRQLQKLNLDNIEEAFEEWAESCVICKARGLETEKTATQELSGSWMTCSQQHQKEDKFESDGFAGAWRALGSIEFEKFSGCMSCWAPQAICQSWESVERSGRQRWKKSSRLGCQYKGVLRDAMAALLVHHYIGLMDEWLEEEQKLVEFKDKEDESDWEKLLRWMSRRVKIGEVEASEMCRIFVIWAKL